MLDFIFYPSKIVHKPSMMFFEALFLTLLSTVCAIWIFPQQYVSIGILAFLTIGAIPIFIRLFSYCSYLYTYNKPFFQRHVSVMTILGYFFLGVFMAYIVLFFFLTPSLKEDVFSTQFNELKGIENIRSDLTGQISGTELDSIESESKHNIFNRVFNLVLQNNLGVVVRAAVLSFFYGAGAIFLIAWNASVLATVIANDIFISMTGAMATHTLLSPLTGIINSCINFIGYLPHGLPEVLAYFLISVAGAMFSRDLIKGIFSTEFKWKALGDICLMILFALLFIVIGALIEASYFL